MAAIVCIDVEGDERLSCCRGSLLKKFVKQFFPRDCMDTRRFCEDPIEIEQNRVVVSHRERDHRRRVAYAVVFRAIDRAYRNVSRWHKRKCLSSHRRCPAAEAAEGVTKEDRAGRCQVTICRQTTAKALLAPLVDAQRAEQSRGI